MGLLPDIAAGVGVDIPTAGHVISAYAVGVVVGAPVIAALGARCPRRALLVGLMAALPGRQRAHRARARLPHAAGRPVPRRPAARRLLRRRLAGRRLAGRAAAARPRGQLGDARAVRRHARRRPGGDLAGPAARLALRLLGRRRPRGGHGGRRARRRPVDRRAGRRPPSAASWARCAGRRCCSPWPSASSGFGGMFAMYSYIAPLVTDVAGLSRGTVPVVLFVFGVGGVVGTALGRPARRLGAVPLAGRRLVAGRAAGRARPHRAGRAVGARPGRRRLPGVGQRLDAGDPAAAAADGDRRRRPDARRRAEPLGAQPRQRPRRVGRRPGDRRRPGLPRAQRRSVPASPRPAWSRWRSPPSCAVASSAPPPSGPARRSRVPVG